MEVPWLQHRLGSSLRPAHRYDSHTESPRYPHVSTGQKLETGPIKMVSSKGGPPDQPHECNTATPVHALVVLGIAMVLLAGCGREPAPPAPAPVPHMAVVGTWAGTDDKRWRFNLRLEAPVGEAAPVVSAVITDPRGRPTSYGGRWGRDGGLVVVQLDREPGGSRWSPTWFRLSAMAEAAQLDADVRGDDCSCTGRVVLSRVGAIAPPATHSTIRPAP